MCHYNMLVAAREMKQEQYQELLQKALHSYGSLFQAFCQLLSATMSSTCVFMLILDSIYVILQQMRDICQWSRFNYIATILMLK